MLKQILHNKFNLLAIAIIISLVIFNYLILFNDVLSRPYLIPPGTMDDLATHTLFTNNIIKYQSYIQSENQGYPPGFHLFFTSLSLITQIKPIEIIKWLYLLFPIFSLLAIYILVRNKISPLSGLFVILTYGMLSAQPFLNLNDGSFVAIIAINFLVVLVLNYFISFYQNHRNIKSLVLAFIIYLGMIIYSAIALFYFTPIICLLVLTLIVIDLFFKKKIGTAKIMLSILFIIITLLSCKILMGNVYFDGYYEKSKTIISNLFLIYNTSPETTPQISELSNPVSWHLPDIYKYYLYTGVEIYWLGIMGLIILPFLKIKRPVKVLIIIWLLVTFLMSRSHIFLLPERFARDLAMPIAILAAILVTFLFKQIKQPTYKIIFFSLALIISLSIYLNRYADFVNAETRIEKIDKEAMLWVNDTLPKTATILSGPYTNYLSVFDTTHSICSSQMGDQQRTLDLTKITEKNQKCDYFISFPDSEKGKEVLKEQKIDYIYTVNEVNNWTDPRTNWKALKKLDQLNFLIPIKNFSEGKKKIIIYQIDEEKL